MIIVFFTNIPWQIFGQEIVQFGYVMLVAGEYGYAWI